jgi:Fe-S cluster assembly protein SufD
MMTMEQDAQTGFQALLASHYAQIPQADLLHKIREKAWEHFLALGLPTRKHELFRSLRMRALFSKQYHSAHPKAIAPEAITPHLLPECQESALVFVNGFFAPAFSRTTGISKKVVISTLCDAMHTYGGFLNSQWTAALKEETDPFAACNLALHRDGLFLYCPPKVVLERPIQILHLIDAEAHPALLTPRVQLFLGAHSEMSLVSTIACLTEKEFALNGVTDITIEEGAQLNYTQATWNLPETSWLLEAFRATLKRNSRLKAVNATNGADSVRNDYRVALIGENAEASLNGVWMLKKKREAHVHVLLDHQAPHCRSMQLFKGALNDTSRSSFEGKIFVRQLAQKTEAYQLNQNLLLSDYAQADSKPNLEIFADDVKASHGSTVGQLDQEQIFYMKTRGYSEAAAKNLLTFGFCQEVLDLITIPSLHQSMRVEAQNYLRQ